MGGWRLNGCCVGVRYLTPTYALLSFGIIDLMKWINNTELVFNDLIVLHIFAVQFGMGNYTHIPLKSWAWLPRRVR